MDNRLGHIEYEDALLYKISKVVVNRKYIEDNSEFWDTIVFKLYEEYYYSKEPISITEQAKSLEIFLSCLFKFKPDNELPEDVLSL